VLKPDKAGGPVYFEFLKDLEPLKNFESLKNLVYLNKLEFEKPPISPKKTTTNKLESKQKSGICPNYSAYIFFKSFFFNFVLIVSLNLWFVPK